ncbi:MAG: Crp/Fnr family transcriptional regulator [Microscillaceae bacterium]|nr:Crp/Fnr family transcriptional regulator [Microscillaceae bacterium]
MKTALENLLSTQREEITLAPRDFLYQEGQAARYIYCLEEGTVFIFKKNTRGQNLWLNFSQPGQILGLIALKKTNYGHSAQALSPVKVLRLEVAKIRDLLHQDMQFRLQIMTELSRQISLNEDKGISLHNKTLRQRIARMFLELIRSLELPEYTENPTLPICCPFHELADFLGASPQKVDKTLEDLVNEGIIRKDEDRIRVLNRRAIEALA